MQNNTPQNPPENAQPRNGEACATDCPCPGDNPAANGKPRGFLSRIFKKCAACAGSGTAGFLAGHAGCVATPLVLAAAGVTTATAGMSALALAFSAAATAGGLYLWHRLRGAQAGRSEKRLVFGSAVAGIALSAAITTRTTRTDRRRHTTAPSRKRHSRPAAATDAAAFHKPSSPRADAPACGNFFR